MDASFYDSIHSALDDKACRVQLAVDGKCGVDRVVWSVWDYIIGPEQLFVWEVQENGGSVGGEGEGPASSENRSNSSFAATDDAGFENDDSHSIVEQSTPVKRDSDVETVPESLIKSLSGKEPSKDVLSRSEGDGLTVNFEDQPNCSYVSVSTVSNKNEADSSSLNEIPVAESIAFGLERPKSQSFSECSSISYNPDGDERYAAVYSLSSEIYKSRTAECPEFKMICVPDRQIVVASYIYSSARKSSTKSRFSISLIFSEHRLKWFLKTKLFSNSYFEDMIVRLKAASLVEVDEELISRMSTELSQYLQILAQLDANSFDSCAFKVSESLLSKADLAKNDFLRRCISVHLQCQGRTVVFGKDPRKVNKLLRTLAFFETRDSWPICKFASVDLQEKTRISDIYSPYLKLQGLSANQKHLVVKECCWSPWPICLIDVDNEIIRHTLPLRKHFERMRRAMKRDINLIAGSVSVEKPVEADFQSHFNKDDFVQPFLAQMDFLPYDDVIREGFLNQFVRFLVFKALALLAFARSATDKGANRTKLKLDRMRTALDLNLDGNFFIVLAMADKYKPGIGQFLVKKQ